MNQSLVLVPLSESFCILKLAGSPEGEAEALKLIAESNRCGAAFYSLSRSSTEVSVVVAQSVYEARAVAGLVGCNPHWACFRVQGVLDFALTGILSSLVLPLKEAQISVFAISTYDTDYILVGQANAALAAKTWISQGFQMAAAQ
ncbi:hypothetical protein HDU91_002643 [Kappamyces sp. JEL0680]|nr:hypothetical protein HDU91_002643 [Kappamyces sp. JEL0680]